MIPSMPNAKLKYVPHKVIRDGAVYLGLSGSDNVLMIKVVVNKVNVLVDQNGHELKGPDGMPMYSTQISNVTTVLTREEWNLKKDMSDLD